jgi:hypothetical protein
MSQSKNEKIKKYKFKLKELLLKLAENKDLPN